jgi:hypothetical protein
MTENTDFRGIAQKRKPKGNSLFANTHPALQGFIFVVIGFGVVLLGTLLGGAQIVSTIVIILGFVIAIYGFIKILTHL